MALELWHGGRRWIDSPAVQAPKKGRYECGPGIYLTNAYERARGKYAKGGGVTTLVTLKDGIRWLETAKLPLEAQLGFVNGTARLHKRAAIERDLHKCAERMRSDLLPACFLVNLCVYHEALSGQPGIQLAAWLAEQGIDASLYSASGAEQWVIVFNPEIIHSFKVVPASEVTDLQREIHPIQQPSP